MSEAYRTILPEDLKHIWKQEEAAAHIRGWDFSHIHGRYVEEQDLPWSYREKVEAYLTQDLFILDYDTGGGEFLLSLGHPYGKTAATEGYEPNVQLCREKLLPLGIRFRPCDDPTHIPFEDESFDLILNRHRSFDPKELYRLLKKGGIFITEQVGSENDRDLVEMVLPETEKPFPHLNLKTQKRTFEDAGFQILEAGEAFRPIRFFDVGAFVWFARIIEWEFPGFSVDRCFDRLLNMQRVIMEKGEVEGTIHPVDETFLIIQINFRGCLRFGETATIFYTDIGITFEKYFPAPRCSGSPWDGLRHRTAHRWSLPCCAAIRTAPAAKAGTGQRTDNRPYCLTSGR